jgi:hypothetical protein
METIDQSKIQSIFYTLNSLIPQSDWYQIRCH